MHRTVLTFIYHNCSAEMAMAIHAVTLGDNSEDPALLCLLPHIYTFQNVFLRCPTPRPHCFLSSHWPSFRFLSFMAFLIPSIQFFFGLPRALFCFGIHFNARNNVTVYPISLWNPHVLKSYAHTTKMET